jgi:hypothetical protein
MRIYKWVTFAAAIVIIALEAFMFTRASTDEIGAPAITATPEVMTPDASSNQAGTSSSPTFGDTR